MASSVHSANNLYCFRLKGKMAKEYFTTVFFLNQYNIDTQTEKNFIRKEYDREIMLINIVIKTLYKILVVHHYLKNP